MSFGIPKTMRAVVYCGVNDLRLEEVPVPRISSSELLVKVEACGICPTDLKKIHYGTLPPPRIYGHETAGTIVKLGARVRGFRLGDRVALHHHVPCMKCHACRHQAFTQCPQNKWTGITAGFEPAGGGYGDFVRVMSFVLPGVVKIPAKNSFIEGAMQEPVNTVLKAVRKLSLLRGDTVLVAGQGPIGLMFTRLFVIAGMKVVATDLMESRLKLARQWGARWTFSPADPNLPEHVRKFTNGRGVDAAVLAVPVDEALVQARELLRPAGQVMLFAHTRRGVQTSVDLASICVDEKDLLGSYAADFRLQKEVARCVFSRQLDIRQLVTHQFPLSQTAAAFELAHKPTPDSLKLVVIHSLPSP